MKSTKYIFYTLIVFLLAHVPLYAQYTGGIADGSSLNGITNSTCGNPANFYAYFGGSGDGQGVHTLINSSCSTPPGGFAYMGGQGDANAVQTITIASCGLPPGAYAYMGGSGDGEGVHTLINGICNYPPSFYAYFGGNGDGAAMDKNRNCAVVLPTADFAASPTTVCINGDVTLSDLSTNALGWEWTLPGATLVTPSTIYSQNPVVRYAVAGTYAVTLKARNLDGEDTEIKTAYITVGGPATITATTPAARCGVGSVTIGATSGGIVRWYAVATGGTLLGTGATFTTPSISFTTTYYAEAYNGCTASSRTAVVATVDIVPTITGTAASRCDSGTVTLSANPSSGTVNWYDAASGGNLLATGAVFTTPSISTTTTYYAEAVSAQGCISSRVPVIATVNTAPTITSTTPASRCDAGSVSLNATSSAGSTIWYAVSSGGAALATTNNFVTPSIATSTTYYVEASLGGCASPRTAVVATVNTTPTITSTTPASRCDSGTVTLAATASGGTLSWYAAPSGGTSIGTGTSFTTPTLSGNQFFYVEAATGTCTSPRTAVLATVYTIPTVNGTSASRCDAGTVTLSAAANVGTISWYAASSGGTALGTGGTFVTPSISNTTTYYAESVNGSCTSTRIPVVATVNTSPTITSTTPDTICSGETFTIGATASAGNLAWYNVSTGGLVQGTGNTYSLTNLSSSFTFYVQATDGSCQSPRTPVAVTVNQTPSLISATGASRCGNGILTLTATYTNGTINWYDQANGGSIIFTGSNFTTPTLTGTTTYYVEAVNGTCISAVRTPITATVNAVPTVTSTTPASRCGTGSVALTATSGVGTLVWYAANTGGTALATGTTFNTPSITGSTTYYVEATNGTCTSTRTAVIATVDVAETIISTTPGSRCDSGSVTLSAAATGGTLNWYANAVGGPILGTGSTFATPSISASTNYYVEVTNGTCTSSRMAVLASVNGLAAPTGSSNQSFCTSGTVASLVTTSGTNIVWYTAATGGTVVPNSTALVTGTTYYASQNNGSCESATRLGVTVTLDSMPTVTSTTPSSRCGAGVITLNAASSAGTLAWYGTSTGGSLLGTGTSFSPAISGTTTYYVQAVNGACISVRTAVIATIDAAQSITSTTPASRCDAGTLTLSAVATGGTLNWYAVSTGGSILGTGSNFTTPPISSSTTYYVEVTNGTCTSSRVAVSASIAPIAAPIGNANQTFCAGETVGLLVITSGSNIVWYNAASGGAVVPNNTPLVAGTTYYASQNNGTCESPTRLAVTVSLGNCLGIDEVVRNTIKWYPNPVTDMLTISATQPMSDVTVIDMLGRVLQAKNVNDTEVKIDMSNYPTGTYLVHVTADNAVRTFKVIRK